MLSEDELRRREEWERCAANAYELPDDEVLEMIREIRELRSKIKNMETCQ